MVNFIVSNIEIIKDVLLSLVSALAFVVVLIVFIKVYLNIKEIKKVNQKIEEEQEKLDQNELDHVGVYSIDITGEQERYQKTLKQNIQKLRREKEYLLEEISIFKIFKK